MTGCTPAFSAATSAEKISGEMPEPPTDSMAARANIVARTMSIGSGSPTAPLRPSSSCRWKALGVAGHRGAEIGAEAGVQSVDRLAGCGSAVEHRARLAQALHHGGAISTVRPCAGDRADVLDANAGAGENDRAHAKRSLWPMPMRLRLRQHGVAERDVAERQAAVPEQDGLVVALAAGLHAGDDLAELGMQRLLAQLAGLDMGAQRAELAALALAPIVDHDLGHDVGQRQLHRAHRAVGHDEGAGLDPFGLEQRLRLRQARGLDDDVGALDAGSASRRPR